MTDASPLRAWGSATWLFRQPVIRDLSWFVIGNVSTQDRCLSIFKHCGSSLSLGACACLEIVDEDSGFSGECKRRRDATRAMWEYLVPSDKRELHTFGLMNPVKPVQTLAKGWMAGPHAKNVILDVSAMPERFFFPLLRWLLESQAIDNLIVTYMLPEKYTSNELAYDAGEWAQLPTFVGGDDDDENHIERVITGVGFVPFSLPDWLKKTYLDRTQAEVFLMFPFPSAPANVRRAWEFVRQIEVSLPLKDESRIVRVAANDLSGCYDRIQLLTKNGTRRAVFAPYGPKPHSVAMCLHALKTNSEVFYTQPTHHHPEYSTGILMQDGLPAGFAYAIRLKGRNLYC